MKRRGFLGLGTNVGKRRENLRRALAELAKCGKIEVSRISSVYQSAPWGVTEQPDFLNLVVEIETELAARELLEIVKEIERQMGRQAGPRWGPRLIDIDILLLGEEQVTEADLVVPHPRLLERAFVLVPLAELAPELMVGGERAAEVAARLAKEQRIDGALPI